MDDGEELQMDNVAAYGSALCSARGGIPESQTSGLHRKSSNVSQVAMDVCRDGHEIVGPQALL